MLNQNLLLTGDDGYNLTKSLRFRSSASAYLNRTPASAGNQQKWTWSGWVKRGALSYGEATLFNAGTTGIGTNDTGFLGIRFTSGDKLDVTTGATDLRLTTQVFRDPSAWYHIVVAFDTTQATGANRVKVYVNGTQVTAYSGTDPSLNLNTAINNTYIHEIARTSWNGAGYFDGYITEQNFVDGQQLTPSSFGSANSLTGVWQPAKYTGTYGTNGFYLPFTNTASTSTLGNDFSGNGNTWTVNNISLTAGNTYDSMTDVPTLTSATAANYAVLNPLFVPPEGSTVNATLTNGNLTFVTSTGSDVSAMSTFPVVTGTYYCELTCTNPSNDTNFAGFGIAYNYPARGRTSGILYNPSGNKRVNDTSSAYGASWTTGDVIGMAINATSNSVTFYKNGASQGAISYTPTTSNIFVCIYDVNHSVPFAGSFNFGQQPWIYTPPTGFLALNTYNLPTSTIVKGNTVMDATAYTGNGTNLAITNTAGFKPDLVWVKGRSLGYSNYLEDSVRGVGKDLSSNGTGAEATFNLLTSFNSNGFTVSTSSGTYLASNDNGVTYVGWNWKAGGAAVTNTTGSITSSVSANTTSGFSVVTFTAQTSGTATVGHGLGVAPSMIITKVRNNTSNWVTYHASFGNTNYILLDSTAASTAGSTVWNNTSPTSSVFTMGSAFAAPSQTMVAYCWSEIAGFSKFGSYTGNGSTDGPFIYTGFRPKLIMVKRTDSAGNWYIYDSSRDSYNAVTQSLYPNLSNAESNDGATYDLLSNGFKNRRGGVDQNASGGTYIYMAFAENPFKNALAR